MRALAALVLVALLAGCLDGGDGQPTPTGSPSPTGSGSASGSGTGAPAPLLVLPLLTAFEFSACRGLQVAQPQPLADVQALLPEGFVARPPPGAASDAAGALVVDLFHCGNLTTPTAALADVYFGVLFTYVARPVDRVRDAPEAPVQEYAFRILAGDAVLAALWPNAGYDTYNGSASVDVGPAADPDTGARVGSAQVGDDYTLLASGMAGTGAPRAGAFARYTVLADASVLVWTGTYAFAQAAAGAGVAEVDEDGPFTEAAAGPPDRPFLRGAASQYDQGAVVGQDLRRVFTSAA